MRLTFTGYRTKEGVVFTHYTDEHGEPKPIPQHNAGVARKELGGGKLTPTYSRGS
jgi:hypothetical protein